MRIAVLDEILAPLAPDSWVRSILTDMLSDDELTRDRACDQITRRRRKPTELEGHAILAAVGRLAFPLAAHSWKNGPDRLVQLLWDQHSDSYVGSAKDAFPQARDRCGAALLVLMAASGSRAGAEAFCHSIREHGWPSEMYERVFTELRRLEDHSDVLFPALIEAEDGWLGHIGDVLLAGIDSGKVAPASLAVVESYLFTELEECLNSATDFQRVDGIAWRFDETYWPVRMRTGFLLDIAGRLSKERFLPLVERALSCTDPRLLLFAASSLVRQGCEVESETLHTIAAAHETRHLLFHYWQSLGRIESFPSRWRTWDAFAAADIAEWLAFPTELGREPDHLEKMTVMESRTPDGTRVLYVWRFKNDDKDKWYAATSGPYTLVGEPCPCHGSATFSRFDEWESATAQEHAESVLNTLGDWWEHEQNRGDP